ncbi:sterol desaturase family protein [Spongiivirga citrea]|uniref:Sterol desaturase n=1 Tax=Spongiivirga citrea TaxID=1481457 RepID=A0A6M0CH02_9FLAO|nr:sterol desaturase family protein [Spongiivirga citrea]NER17105.1 sterol desaturase [Spongiivirga citrea]
METYATALSYAIPGFAVLILVEYFISVLMKKQVNYGLDTISSISSGLTNTLKTLMGLTVVIVSHEWMVTHLAIYSVKSTALIYILCFIGHDFAGYWSHRFNHTINLFWNRHIIHHSSEEFNLACALRQSVSAIVGIYFFLYIPMALIGIPVEVVALVAPIHFFAQFWYHTRLINKMGFLEYIIVTPSHHRVHHAINDRYLDKNYSEIFIVWDKLFGTFQKELEEDPPVYGVKKPVRTWNPLLINFIHLWGIIKDAWRTKSWKDKLRIWFMPTGWRPKDVKIKYPISIIENPFEMEKYRTSGSLFFVLWGWFQLVLTLVLMYFLLISVADLNMTQIVGYAMFLMISIFAYTSLMDRHGISLYAEIGKLALGAYFIYSSAGWFGLEKIIPFASYAVGVYLLISLLTTIYLLYYEKKNDLGELIAA